MYKKIINPLTKRKVDINSRLGKHIINNYINSLKGGCSINSLFKNNVNQKILKCRVNQKKNTREETLFCKLHNLEEGIGLRTLFSEINISNIVTPELQQNLEKLFLDIHDTGYIQQYFGGSSPVPMAEITLNQNSKKAIILEKKNGSEPSLDKFTVMTENSEKIKNLNYSNFRVKPSEGEIFTYLNYKNTREIIRTMYNFELNDSLIHNLRDQYFYFLNKIMMARSESNRKISFSVFLMSDFFKILDTIIKIIQYLSMIVKSVSYIGPSKKEKENYSWYGNLIPFFGIKNIFYKLVKNVRKKGENYIKNWYIIPCVDNLRYLLQEYLGDYGLRLKLLEPCCLSGQTSVSLSTTTCELSPMLDNNCNLCTSKFHEKRSRSSRDYCYYVDNEGNYNGFCKDSEYSTCKKAAKNSQEEKFRKNASNLKKIKANKSAKCPPYWPPKTTVPCLDRNLCKKISSKEISELMEQDKDINYLCNCSEDVDDNIKLELQKLANEFQKKIKNVSIKSEKDRIVDEYKNKKIKIIENKTSLLCEIHQTESIALLNILDQIVLEDKVPLKLLKNFLAFFVSGSPPELYSGSEYEKYENSLTKGKIARLGLNQSAAAGMIHGDYVYIRKIGDNNGCLNQTVDKLMWEYWPFLPNLIFNLKGLFYLDTSEQLHDWCEMVNKNYLNKYKNHTCKNGEDCSLCIGEETTWKYGTPDHLRSVPLPENIFGKSKKSLINSFVNYTSPLLIKNVQDLFDKLTNFVTKIDITLIKDIKKISKRKTQIRKNALKKFKKIANTVKIANYLDKVDNEINYDKKTIEYINRVNKKISNINISWKEIFDILNTIVNLIKSLKTLTDWLNSYNSTRGTGMLDRLITNHITDIYESVDEYYVNKPLKQILKKELWPIVRNLANSINSTFTPIGIEFTSLNKIIANLKEGDFFDDIPESLQEACPCISSAGMGYCYVSQGAIVGNDGMSESCRKLTKKPQSERMLSQASSYNYRKWYRQCEDEPNCIED